jgi:hypothetical protein
VAGRRPAGMARLDKGRDLPLKFSSTLS